jgi:hypothetical protein
VKPAAIRKCGFATVSYKHALAARLGLTGSTRKAKHRGYQVHSVLLRDAHCEETMGLLDQSVQRRKPEQHGKRRHGSAQSDWGRRWRELSKAYKSSVGVERQRFQSPENLKRMMAFLAVRMLQLQESEKRSTVRCDEALTEDG